MSDFDNFRRLVNDDEDIDAESTGMPIDIDSLIDSNTRPRSNRRFLGLSAGQRAFLSMIVFLNVLILGAGLLIVTGRVVF